MAQNCVLEEGNTALMPTRLKYEVFLSVSYEEILLAKKFYLGQ
jgi:hypothetical protein